MKQRYKINRSDFQLSPRIWSCKGAGKPEKSNYTDIPIQNYNRESWSSGNWSLRCLKLSQICVTAPIRSMIAPFSWAIAPLICTRPTQRYAYTPQRWEIWTLTCPYALQQSDIRTQWGYFAKCYLSYKYFLRIFGAIWCLGVLVAKRIFINIRIKGEIFLFSWLNCHENNLHDT